MIVPFVPLALWYGHFYLLFKKPSLWHVLQIMLTDAGSFVSETLVEYVW